MMNLQYDVLLTHLTPSAAVITSAAAAAAGAVYWTSLTTTDHWSSRTASH